MTEAATALPVGVILAGGLARRMDGHDKALLRLDDGATLLDVLIGRLGPQCDGLAISANGDPHRFSDRGPVVLPDGPGPSRGPLAGILEGLDHGAAINPQGWMLSVPGDTPFVPADLVPRLRAEAHRSGRPVVRATSGDRPHPLVALWRCDLREALRQALLDRDLRKVMAFQAEVGVAEVAWPTMPHDPFFNLNTPDDLVAARRLHAGLTGRR
ncbi:molybdenum cofactor guanylyltransferase MobA [Lichenihabitans sp. Uapishka_5]|uniref:molybdenum cofactor guanylyltransferase MobA n=1 Tax=Lichenihabitans sp. Uapishka_5 TaxID=3037302 RepID=UPI0029E7D4ED|nr:molybdenum cofactor guanylyltransferase MobA [Lichenihabitans sp. Uapishka_5]MDX7950911.1 molybdenum cofactor guanylyltransferase MobA [Lichenihabitans sp. Uapishka_5]